MALFSIDRFKERIYLEIIFLGYFPASNLKLTLPELKAHVVLLVLSDSGPHTRRIMILVTSWF